MDTITIQSANGTSSLTLLDREPTDPSLEVTHFTVRLNDTHFSASTRVYAYMCGGLLDLLDHVARSWQDFRGPQSWSALECDFNIDLSHDGLGHFTLRIGLDSSPVDDGWEVVNHVIVETAQLDRIAADVRSFIGVHS